MLHLMNLESMECATRGSVLDVVASDTKVLLYGACVMLCVIMESPSIDGTRLKLLLVAVASSAIEAEVSCRNWCVASFIVEAPCVPGSSRLPPLTAVRAKVGCA